jgi:PhnB protein
MVEKPSPARIFDQWSELSAARKVRTRLGEHAFASAARSRKAGTVNAPSPRIMPYLYYPDATLALQFLVTAFGFDVVSEVRDQHGAVWNAKVSCGDSVVMIGPASEAFGTRAIADPAWATHRLHVLVPDVDAQFARACAAGATVRSEPHDFGGTRICVLADCGGHQWIFARGDADGP